MGGYNSGRTGWRGVIEYRKRLDVRTFHSHRLLNPPGVEGTWRWTADGETTSTVGYRVQDDALELNYALTNDDGGTERVRYCIGFDRVPCRYGGQRFYWRCPWCSRRCEVLAIARQGREWACRNCLRLRYHSQGLTPGYRMQARADKIYARLGATDSDYVPKPKRMRWRTFNRQMDLANELTTQADWQFVLGLRRFGFAGSMMR